MIGLTEAHVIMIHDDVINSNELQGLASDKSLASCIDRIDKRIDYALIGDVYHLAACYAAFIAQAHAFNDANKRTAFAAMDMILALNGIELEYDPVIAGDMIISIVTGQVDENDLAAWLRKQ
ncbi:type II toxin-antitoxin system death-on-curing family toxin [Noviherbaspirillum sedimenti]|uniref:Type II toxin-antitoxin system death-on-curing family toxin n=1 Tax=Noviherbaspirillum sedimenti TaxID=2320865 RepID=A0A3A3G6A4_9BURK|nr:type II toxin-antitoxin system death-on-curing family toxin [Noviherbaspirillum sedimenti]RJG02062.1 type II toxin-antitoxin system death-on-curing family toxin [Noviherbaspirillum sedimenti]